MASWATSGNPSALRGEGGDAAPSPTRCACRWSLPGSSTRSQSWCCADQSHQLGRCGPSPKMRSRQSGIWSAISAKAAISLPNCFSLTRRPAATMSSGVEPRPRRVAQRAAGSASTTRRWAGRPELLAEPRRHRVGEDGDGVGARRERRAAAPAWRCDRRTSGAPGAPRATSVRRRAGPRPRAAPGSTVTSTSASRPSGSVVLERHVGEGGELVVPARRAPAGTRSRVQPRTPYRRRRGRRRSPAVRPARRATR